MSERDDGGPAFGHGSSNGHCCGMTTRDYFAAHAPQFPPWFWPEMPEKPEPTYNANHNHDACPPFAECRPDNDAERLAWERELVRQRTIQWPYVWADLMLVQRQLALKAKA